MASRSYQVGASRITLILGDLLTSSAEVLVSSDDYLLSMSGAPERHVGAALRHAAGAEIEAEARKLVPAKAGDVVVTSAGRLPAKYILHAVTIGHERLQVGPDVVVRESTRRAMRLLPLLGCHSIAFPVIGTGAAGIPFQTAVAQMAGELVGALLQAPTGLQVELYLKPRAEADAEGVFDTFETHVSRKLGLDTSRQPGTSEEVSLGLARPLSDRREHVFQMLRHLDARRDHLESQLIQVLTGETAGLEASLAELRTRLAEIQEMRQRYETELAPSASQPNAAIPNTVFLSSTSADLELHRKTVREAIERVGMRFVGMEVFSPTEQAPASLIRRKVDQSQFYLGVIGMRYGYVEPASGLSMTELEYRQAIASGKAVFLFIMDKRAPITPEMVETDPASFGKLVAFRERLMKAHTCGFFTDAQDLGSRAETTLRQVAPGP